MSMRNDIHPSKFAAVTPSDTAALDLVGIYVGVTGNLAIAGEDGTAVTFEAVPVGVTIWGHVTLVKATGTTASDLVGYIA
ncbi:MAG: spike base protein, RCAP_Rcc01079 family [Rhizomicrobium sp.]